MNSLKIDGTRYSRHQGIKASRHQGIKASGKIVSRLLAIKSLSSGYKKGLKLIKRQTWAQQRATNEMVRNRHNFSQQNTTSLNDTTKIGNGLCGLTREQKTL